jgi:hypothetical protein
LLCMQLDLRLVCFHFQLTELHGNKLGLQHLHTIGQVEEFLLCRLSLSS